MGRFAALQGKPTQAEFCCRAFDDGLIHAFWRLNRLARGSRSVLCADLDLFAALLGPSPAKPKVAVSSTAILAIAVPVEQVGLQ